MTNRKEYYAIEKIGTVNTWYVIVKVTIDNYTGITTRPVNGCRFKVATDAFEKAENLGLDIKAIGDSYDIILK